MYLIDNCVGFFHGFLLPCLELPESDCWFSHFLSLCAQTSDLRRRFWMTRIHPPKFNSEFIPEKWWLEDDPFLLGPSNFFIGNVKLREGRF